VVSGRFAFNPPPPRNQINASDVVAGGTSACPTAAAGDDQSGDAWATLWHADAPAAGGVVCMQQSTATGQAAVVWSQDGRVAPLQCGQEWDNFLAPTDSAYDNDKSDGARGGGEGPASRIVADPEAGNAPACGELLV
jgi:hypothetical protein